MDTDRKLLFGVLALQADLLGNDRFAEACSAWVARKDTPLADLLGERAWLSVDTRSAWGNLAFLKTGNRAPGQTEPPCGSST